MVIYHLGWLARFRLEGKFTLLHSSRHASLQVYEAGKPRASDKFSPGLHMTMQQGVFFFTPKVSGLSKNDLVLLLVRRLAVIAANYT